MANKKSDSDKSPQLKRVLLKSFALNSFLDKTKHELDMSFEKKISMDIFGVDVDDLIRLSVTINIVGTASVVGPSKKNVKSPCLKSEADYQGRYVFPPNTSKEEAIAYIDIKPNQDVLIAQVNSIAMKHFKDQLDFAGYSTRALPLSL